MAQNRLFIAQEKRFKRAIYENTARCYAAFVLATYDMGLVPKEDDGAMFETYVELLSKTQDYFYDSINGLDVVKRCADVTGINMMSELTAKEQNIGGKKI